MISRVDAFAYASRNTTIGFLDPDPDWVPSIRTQLGLLGEAGGRWQLSKPTIWSNILAPFKHYCSLFLGVVDVADELSDDQQSWDDLLKMLQDTANGYRAATTTAEYQFNSQLQRLKAVESVLRENMGPVWAELEKEEEKFAALVAAVTRLQGRFDELQEKIDSAALWGNIDFTKSAASINYTLVTSLALVGVPYLSIVGMIYTVGKSAYDVITTDAEIDNSIREIVATRQKMTEEAQAAGMTKAVIQLIYNFDKSLSELGTSLPNIDRMWAHEAEKLAQVRKSIAAGARPSRLTELAHMKPAQATWAHLAEFADKISRGGKTGPPVSLSIDKPNRETA